VNYPVASCFRFAKIEHAAMLAGTRASGVTSPFSIIDDQLRRFECEPLFSPARSAFQNQNGVLPWHCRSLFLAKVRPIQGVNALTESDQVGVRTTTGVNASLHHLLKAAN
jgi:hypothetical protein